MESGLPQCLHEHVNTLIAAGQVATIQDVMDWMSCSYMYRRIARNPNFYEIAGRSEDQLNEFLSELVEDTVSELAELGYVEIGDDEMELRPRNLGRIASHYGLRH